MKFSKYVLLGKNINDKTFIFNTFYKTCYLISEKEADIIKQAIENNDIKQLDNGLKQKLISANDIIDESTNESELVDYDFCKLAYTDDTLDLTIITTNACNFKCVYCYQKYNPEIITEENAEKIIKFIDRETDFCKTLIINWFGGEPLLTIDTIINMSQKIIDITRKKKITYLARMTTNGYLLTPEVFSKLLKLHIYTYLITIDSTEEKHNLQRPLQNGQGTYKTIFNNLLEIKKIKKNFILDIRCNITTYNLSDIDTFIDTMNGYFSDDKRFSVVFESIQDWKGSRIKDHMDLLLNNEYIINNVYTIASKRGINLQSYLKYQHQVQMCPAIKKRGYTISFDASVHKCEMAMHDPVFKDVNKIGQIDENGILSIVKENEARWITRRQNLDQCYDCICYPYCMGGAQCNFGMKFHYHTRCQDKIAYMERTAALISLQPNCTNLSDIQFDKIK